MNTLYWHDYETTGIDPKADRPIQFAGLRTDEQLNIIGKPLNIHCRLSPDVLPHPEATLVTGITPQIANEKGLTEAAFMRRIYQELGQMHTCGVGYNSVRFDDEFSRYGFYRNFIDPYAREWQNGNSRWDIIDLLRMTRALRPEGIEWPDHEDGSPNFKLEALTVANDIQHDNAHDALADVYASIAMAKLVLEKQPRLYQYLFNLRSKKAVQQKITLFGDLLVHSSGMMSKDHLHTSVVLPLFQDAHNPNKIIAYDLRYDPEELLDLDAENLRYRLFTPTDELEAGENRIHLKGIHVNKCPAIAPLGTLNDTVAECLALDMNQCQQHAARLRQARDLLKQKLNEVYQKPDYSTDDVEHALYDGFFGNSDKQKIRQVHQTPLTALNKLNLQFFDPRLPELLFRYRARNAPETLSLNEQQKWQQFCRQRLQQKAGGANINLAEYYQQISQLREQEGNDPQLLDELEAYAQSLEQAFVSVK